MKNIKLTGYALLFAACLTGCTTPCEEASIKMNEYINQIQSGHDDAVFLYGKEYVDNYREIIALGDITVNGVTYRAPESADDVSNALILYFDGFSVSIDKLDYSAEYANDFVDLELPDTYTEQDIDSVNNLYDFQRSFAAGTNMLIEIPPDMAEDLYNNYEVMKADDVAHLPTLLREYAVTNTVYFDYDSGVSVVYDRTNHRVSLEKTDIDEMNNYMEKEHKL